MLARKPLVSVLLGVFALSIALLSVAPRTARTPTALGSWWIVPGTSWFACSSTGFMRGGSQASLFLAPIATVVLVFAWISVRTPPPVVLQSNQDPNSQFHGNATSIAIT